MLQDDKIWVAQGDNPCYLLLNQANRHGLIAGASGTGKTVTLKLLAEGFSKAGVPVFMADVKGDVTGMVAPGELTSFIEKRMDFFGMNKDEFVFEGTPMRVWDMLGDKGLPVRITISDMGPVLLSRLLDLTEVQQGVLNIVFHIADDQQLLLIDLKDLRTMLNFVSEHAKEYETSYGRMSSASIGAIQRALMAIEDQGGDIFFGEPDINLDDWFATTADGQGYVNILNASRLIQMPQIYAMFLLWMLSTLYDRLPEVGDPDKPKFVFFFDEAHLLFDGMPKSLTEKVVQVVKLIRSKGVGVYFITQTPSDIPNEVLAQLSNRVQHGLRAYTPAEQKAVRAAANAFRANPNFKSEEALQDLGTGEALVSFLDEEGRPAIVERAKVLFPQCSMNAASEMLMEQVYGAQEALMVKYGDMVDRVSAYEMIAEKRAEEAEAARLAAERAQLEKERAEFERQKAKEAERAAREAEREAARLAREAEKEAARIKREEEKAAESKRKAVNSVATEVAGTLLGKYVGGKTTAKAIVRGILGNLGK